MSDAQRLQAGDRVLVGRSLIEVSSDFADQLEPGDAVLGIAQTGQLRRIPLKTEKIVSRAVSEASAAFRELANIPQSRVTDFYSVAARLFDDDDVFASIATVNAVDVASARERGRSTTRLVLSDKMRADMVSAFHMWATFTTDEETPLLTVEHDGWSVSEYRAPLGVVGFVFEGRPNVFADATGVLRGGNTVVFRIGRDALGTARAIMKHVIQPALKSAGLPEGSVTLIDSEEHAAGWSLFSNPSLALAVARGSGEAVAELGSIAQQSGIPVSLHGTGGAWLIVGEDHDAHRLFDFVQYSLDRKVCNTMNVVCCLRSQAHSVVPQVFSAAEAAAQKRNTYPRVHAVGGAELFLPQNEIQVARADGMHTEPQVTISQVEHLSHEFEWEENPEFFVVLVESIDEAIELFNLYSPQFVVSVCSENAAEKDRVWIACNAPFVGDGFTRWVDGQFALLRPELGLSNWQTGRLFARSGILSGDSVFSVRLRATQTDSHLHR